MPRLVFLERFVEEVRAPVCEAADDAAVGEDEGAGCARESGEMSAYCARGYGAGKEDREWRKYSLTSLVVCGLPTRA